jgi:hypothetical protein
MSEVLRRAEIARLNDRLRTGGEGGSIFMSAGIAALPAEMQDAIIRAVRQFSNFNGDNDPHGEHDCAVVAVPGHRIIWKIDYFPIDDGGADPDPTDPASTKRVMTIMLAEEY